MQFLSDLWLPICVSAVFVWIASFLMHMVVGHHKSEWAGHPDEPKLLAALEGVKPGQYMFPWGTMKDMKDPAFIAKQKSVPNGTLNIWDGPINMGRNLLLTLLFYLVVGVFIAYISWLTVPMDSPFMFVLRITGCAAFMAHGLGWMPDMIWFRGKGFWANLIDSIVYAAVTGATFGWLWPHGTT